MLKRKFFIGIGLVLLLGIVTFTVSALTISSTDPSSSNVDDTESATRAFNFTVGEPANFTWYLNGSNVTSGATPTSNSTSSVYTNSSATLGYWNITVDAVSVNDSTVASTTWWWNVTAAAPSAPTISLPLPSSPFSSYAGVSQEFNISISQSVTVNWTIDGVLVSNTTGTSSSYTNLTPVVGNYTVKANATNANGTDEETWTWQVTTAPDSTPPASVTGLSLIGNGTTWLNISWINPSDSDFDKVNIYLDGSISPRNSTSSNTTSNFNISGLTSGTSYNITVKTVDSNNNINATAVNITASTDDNTPVASDVIVNLENSTKVTFTTVTGSGNTASALNGSAPSLPVGGYQAVGAYIDITTTATFTGSIEVRVKYDPSSLPTNYQESDISLYHWNGSTSQWDNITTGRNEGNNIVFGTVSSLSPFVAVIPPKPVITKVDPTTLNVQTIGSESKTFKITVNQTANVKWYINNVEKLNSSSILANVEVNYTPPSQSAGNYNLSVVATNANGSDTEYWNWTVRTNTWAVGNRIWDGGKPSEYSLTYTWNPMSFYAFYYDLDGNVGNESLQVTLSSTSDRTIDENDLVYTSTPQAVAFKYSTWGTYNVVGFMAEKYFAGYVANPTGLSTTAISTIDSKQLHRVISDDDTRRVLYVGGTVALGEGYVLKAKDIDITGGKTVFVSLLKDGGEVDSTVVSAGNTYVYSKKVGAISDVPIIAVHIDTVFSGAESNAAFLDGLFQISESYTSVTQGNKYGIMKVTAVDNTQIQMKNDNTLSLASGTTSDIMGDIKFKVADNSTLRFAPTVQKTGIYEVRGTISNNVTASTWTPMSFEGFYYNIDEDVGSENLSLTRTGRTVSENDLIYTSTPQSVSFKYSTFGAYNVVGFMAKKYFAGYTAASTVTGGTVYSTIDSKQLHEVLTDDDTRRAVYGGSTLTLNEGYVLKVTDVDITGGKIVLLSLLKDGDEVDTTAVAAGNTYTYQKKVGSVSDLPIIAVNIETVFSGSEANAAFVKGIFQISESYTTVNVGDQFGTMKVSEVSATKIQMKNTNTITLSTASDIDVMGDIKFKVADDSTAIRFYPYIMVDSGEVAANTLTVDAPANPMERDTITITVTAGSGTAVEGSEISFDNTVIGTTDSEGKVEYTLADSGLHNISATKLGYESDVKSIDVKVYLDTQLKFELPAIIDQGVPVIIKVTAGEITVAGASITLDSTEIGTTDISGELNYSFEISGTHNLGASKTNYISVVREISIRMPFSEYKALDINLTPPVISEGEETVIKANITNVGTKADDRQVELIINGTVVDNKSLTLEPGEVKEINFTREVELLKGNYTVEILGQKDVLRVDEKSTSILLLGGILTGLGAIVIYFLTSKKITLVMVKQFIANLNAETVKEGLRNAPGTISTGLRETGWKLKDAFNELMSKFRKQ